MGVKVELGQELGKDFNLYDLKDYDAVVLAIGTKVPMKNTNVNESIEGIYYATDLLEHNIEMPNFENKEVSIIGGGNVAIDIARTIERLGGNANIIYRRSEKEMPANTDEIEEAKKEGVKFLFQANYLEFFDKDNRINEIELIKTELIKTDDSRPTPVNIEGSNFRIKTDALIFAIGEVADEKITSLFECDNNHNVIINSNGQINVINDKIRRNQKFYAVGDVAGNKKFVAFACKSGRDIAYNIIKDFYNESMEE